MHRYELLLDHADGGRGLEFLTCETDFEAMQHARHVLHQRREVTAVHVRRDAEHLFTLVR
jgi:hypothetical protein